MDVGAGVRDLEDLYRRQYERFARVAAAVAGDVEAGMTRSRRVSRRCCAAGTHFAARRRSKRGRGARS